MFLMETAEITTATGTELSPFFAWLMSQLYAIAGIRSPFLTAIFSGLTYLGHEMGFLVIAMILLWCLNKKYGYRLLIIFLIGTFLHQILKARFMIPRPWVLDPNFTIVESARAAATGFSFPSGHTLTACLALGGIAMYLKKKWAYAVAAVLVLLVAFSRMYLGVHTLLDVGVGLLLGILLLVVFEMLFKKQEDSKLFIDIWLGVGILCSVVLLIYLLVKPLPDTQADSVKQAYELLGAGIGMLIGKLIDDRFVKFETPTVWWKQIIKVLLGLAIVVMIWLGLKMVFPKDQPIFDGIRYCMMALVGVGFYPMLFKKLFKPAA